METTTMGVEYLRPVRVAQRYDISVRTLRRMRAEGRGPKFSFIGRQVRYRADDLDEWVRENRGGK